MKYYSDVTKKLYNTEDELVAAEKVVKEAEEKKAKAAKSKKEEASKVEDAFKARNAARRVYNEKIVALRKEYNTTVVNAKKAFDDAVAEAVKAKDAAEEVYNTALKDFTSKHPEGYHMTLKDGDNVMTVSSAGDTSNEVGREYTNLLDHLLNFWKL